MISIHSAQHSIPDFRLLWSRQLRNQIKSTLCDIHPQAYSGKEAGEKGENGKKANMAKEWQRDMDILSGACGVEEFSLL